jgi:putative ubiquitin-RnfH superfamily antitoxin RatB of RatAB toxin-antitoxin module
MNGAAAEGEAGAGGVLRIEVLRAWPRRHRSVRLDLRSGATVADAVRDCGIALEGVAGYAVFGELATMATPLRDGDRVELLEALRMDPKEARRRRARR